MPEEFNYNAALSLQQLEGAEKIEKKGLEKKSKEIKEIEEKIAELKIKMEQEKGEAAKAGYRGKIKSLEEDLQEYQEIEQEIDQEYTEAKSGKEFDGLTKEIMGSFNEESRERLFKALSKYRELTGQDRKSSRKIFRIKQDSDLAEMTKIRRIKKYETEQEKTRQDLEVLETSSPEAFLGINFLKLRRDAREYAKNNIVETPYVKNKKKLVKHLLTNNQIPFLYGETGTGKTEVSKKIAKELTVQEAVIIQGSEKTTYEELIGYLALLKSKELPAEKIPSFIKDELEKFDDLNPDLSQKEKQRMHAMIEDVIKARMTAAVPETQVKLSQIFEAAQNGQMVIIDEANLIPPAILGVLHTIFDAAIRKGSITSPFTGKKIIPKKGWGFILTGNITHTSTNRYKRYEFDPATKDRLVLVDYNTPDQETDRDKVYNDEKNKKRDLFRIGITSLLDKRGKKAEGSLTAPVDVFDKVWRLSQTFKKFQNDFAGIEPISLVTSEGEIPTWLEKNHASMRKFTNILDQWKKDNYKYELEHYIWLNLIKPAMTTPQEAAVFYTTLQNFYDFFKSGNWPQNPDFRVVEGAVTRFAIDEPQTPPLASPEQKVKIIDTKTLIEAVDGRKTPPLAEDVDAVKKAQEKQKNLEYTKEIQREVTKFKEALQVELEKLKNVFGEQIMEPGSDQETIRQICSKVSIFVKEEK